MCALGTDCDDCGPRDMPPPAPLTPPSPPLLPGGGYTWVPPGRGVLQAAVNAAADNAVLTVAGNYTDSFNAVLLITKPITIRALTPGAAVLDGENARRVVSIYNAGTVVLDGLHITRGSISVRAHTPAPPPSPPRYGEPRADVCVSTLAVRRM